MFLRCPKCNFIELVSEHLYRPAHEHDGNLYALVACRDFKEAASAYKPAMEKMLENKPQMENYRKEVLGEASIKIEVDPTLKPGEWYLKSKRGNNDPT